MPAFGYIRVSSVTQVRDGDGLGVQRARIEAFCQFSGLALASIEADEGVSGASMENRPGLRRVLREVLRAGSSATLVVYKIDRLGRNAIEVQSVLAVLLDSGVRVVGIADGVDSASGMGAALLKLLTSTLAAFSEVERESIRTRLLDARRRADAQDRPYSSEPRYGRRLRADSNELVPDPEEQRVLARVRELRSAGLTYRAIGAALTAEGLQPRRARSWSPIVLQRMIVGRSTPQRRRLSASLQAMRDALLVDGVVEACA